VPNLIAELMVSLQQHLYLLQNQYCLTRPGSASGWMRSQQGKLG
jgi:hypothetical protein